MWYCQTKLGLSRGLERYHEVVFFGEKMTRFGRLNAYIATFFFMITGMNDANAGFVEECSANIQIPEGWEDL
jgi:hypothetical protein